MQLRPSLELAGRNLLNILDPAHRHLPFYKIDISRELCGWALLESAAHNIARWWDAMLRLEEATGFIIPADIEAAMLENIHAFYDNPDHLLLYPWDDERYPRVFARFLIEYHSMREGLLALAALARIRNSRWAADKGHKMLQTLRSIASERIGTWDVSGLARYKVMEEKPGGPCSNSTLDTGRCIEALCFFYEATGDALALELADLFARIHLEHSTRPDGEYVASPLTNHAHSYLGTLRGLVFFGQLTNQQKYIDAAAATYRKAVRSLVKESGYICHDIDKETGGDPASAGDAALIALWLSRNGHTDLLDDVERITRARLVPSQLTQCPPLGRWKLEKTPDGKRCTYINVVSRAPKTVPVETVFYPDNMHELAVGGWGIHAEAHGGNRAVTDVTAATLQCLCDTYNHIVTRTDSGLHVNLHLDHEDKQIKVTSKRGKEATVTVVAKTRENVFVRIPGWTPPESVRVTVNGNPLAPAMLGPFACVPGRLLPGEIALTYALPARKTKERTDGVDYEFTWRGDEITGISPDAGFLPFYPTAQ